MGRRRQSGPGGTVTAAEAAPPRCGELQRSGGGSSVGPQLSSVLREEF